VVKAFWRSLQHCPAPIRIVGFLGSLVVISLPVTGPLLWLDHHRPSAEPFGLGILLTLLVLFLANIRRWCRQVHGLRAPWRRLGFVGGRRWWLAWWLATLLGALGVATLYGIQLWLGWAAWTALPPNMGRILLEGTLAATVVGLGEELIFRGWLLMEFEADYGPDFALGANALVFALAHYIRPWSAILETWPQFIGLLLLGCTLVWARRSPLPHSSAARPHQRLPQKTALAFPAGLHGGLVWAYYQVNVADLIVPTGAVPNWVTGVDGNPLAGGLGLALLGAIALLFYRLSHRRPTSRNLHP
jgi:membrane protease YdiL (CAAX protease family)